MTYRGKKIERNSKQFMCEWMAEQAQGRMTENQILLKATRNEKLWGAKIAHVLEECYA